MDRNKWWTMSVEVWLKSGARLSSKKWLGPQEFTADTPDGGHQDALSYVERTVSDFTDRILKQNGCIMFTPTLIARADQVAAFNAMLTTAWSER